MMMNQQDDVMRNITVHLVYAWDPQKWQLTREPLVALVEGPQGLVAFTLPPEYALNARQYLTDAYQRFMDSEAQRKTDAR